MDEDTISYALSQIGRPTTNFGLGSTNQYSFSPTQFGSSINGGLIAPSMDALGGTNPIGLNPQTSGMGMQYGGKTATPGLNLNQGNGFGFNMPTMQLGLQGLASIGNLYLGSKALGMAKDQFDFSKQMAQTNLKNQVTSYNTGLEDRLRTREQFNTGASGEAWKSDFERLKTTT